MHPFFNFWVGLSMGWFASLIFGAFLSGTFKKLLKAFVLWKRDRESSISNAHQAYILANGGSRNAAKARQRDRLNIITGILEDIRIHSRARRFEFIVPKYTLGKWEKTGSSISGLAHEMSSVYGFRATQASAELEEPGLVITWDTPLKLSERLRLLL